MNKPISNVIIKSHPKSIIRPVEMCSPTYFALFSNSMPKACIDGETQDVIVLQLTKIDNYVIVEYIDKKSYEDSKEDIPHD